MGALVGSIVGDALGAPFEFRPAGTYSRRFPEPVLRGHGEMVGGGGWQPGEWTDDTQMSLLVAESLLARRGLDEADLYERFQAWLAGGPKDVGIQTRAVLSSPLGWQESAPAYASAGNRAAGNGALMRTTPVAIAFADAGREATMDAARRVSLLTHGDPAAGEGCAIFSELVRVALNGGDPLAAVAPTLELVDERLRERFENALDEEWQPDGTDANVAVWGALGTAVWALRQASSFAEAVVRAIDTGDDADTVGCITGGLAGAVFGIGGIPSRWSSPIHGSLIGPADSGYDLASLRDLAAELAGLDPDTPPEEPTWSPRGPHLVDVRGLWVADREGASRSHEVVPNAHVISLSKVAHVPSQPHWRRMYLVDSEDPDENLALEQVLDDVLSTVKACIDAGDPVIVHCYAGESRTGLVLRAWLMERDGLTEAEATAAARELWPHIKTWNTAFTDLLRRRERSGTVPRGGRQ
jgi:ADP-ribosyl-[dinitrogen reductase] hydrolase